MENQTERMYEFMKVESNRLKTFQMNPPWPKDYVDIKKLAKAGFFYAFNGDNVHCAFCRGQVCRWDRDDDPMSEHAKHFTTCPFIMGGEVGNEPLGEDPFPGPKRPRPYDVCGMYSSFPPNESSNQTRERIHNQYSSTDRDNTTDNQRAIQEYNGDLGLRDPIEPERHEQQPEIPSDQSAENQMNLRLNHTPAYDSRSLESQVTHSPSSNSSNCSSSSSSLNGICKICYTNSIELVFLPCGHSVSCLLCARRLNSCPCCRSEITTRIRTFLV